MSPRTSLEGSPRGGVPSVTGRRSTPGNRWRLVNNRRPDVTPTPLTGPPLARRHCHQDEQEYTCKSDISVNWGHNGSSSRPVALVLLAAVLAIIHRPARHPSAQASALPSGSRVPNS